jgi:crotonobetaine/carnitine-CoA ligase
VAAGQPGELLIRHRAENPRKGFFSGYLNDPEATETAWRGGWFHTGDTVTMDASGMLYFVDRKKNIIRRSGENVAAAEVEAVISVLERVRQVAIIAAPDELREEEIMAVIVPRSPQDAGESLAREVFDACTASLAYYKAPGWFVFLNELPTTSTQKIRKISIFPAGTDPRAHPGALDFRALKKKSDARTAS